MKRIILPLLLLSQLFCSGYAADSILSVHGSGSSNPSKCFGSIMEDLQARSFVPVRLTYRAVGSSVGLEEFINEYNPTRSKLDFGIGEIPMKSEDWQKFHDNNVTVLHLPTLFGAVSFFHSVPDTPTLNLTSCLLARIFTRDITDWVHPDIREINPELSKLFESDNSLGSSLRIRVARRESGSSSTKAITEYLHSACPRYFPAEMVGDLPPWPADTDSCRQTQGMTDCIHSRAGTIGYLDAGFGVSAGLQEITLQNKFGRLLNSQDATRNGGVVARSGVLPTDPTADFGGVSAALVNQDGEWTWPITLLTFLYVRMDLGFIEEPNARSLLVALIKTFYDPEYVDRCVERYGFTLASGAALDVAQKGIAMLESRMGDASTVWTFEDKPQALVGAESYVISSNRAIFAKSERDANYDQIQNLLEMVEALQARVATMKGQEQLGMETTDEEHEFTDGDAVLIWISLILGALGFLMGSWNLFQSYSSSSKTAESADNREQAGV